jgi:Rnl2 family RNA ligase
MFLKYTSLENSYRQKFINNIDSLGVSEWVTLEKLHGANFSFAYDHSTITVNRRNGTIDPEEISKFYDCAEVVDAHYDKVEKLSKILGISCFVLYGELVGQGIMKEIIYGDKNFYAFDIYDVDAEKWLDWDVVRDVCYAAGINCVPEVSRGTLEDMLLQDTKFKSKVTPPEHIGSNWSEGYVIKQLRNEVTLSSGKRAIVKKKSDLLKLH